MKGNRSQRNLRSIFSCYRLFCDSNRLFASLLLTFTIGGCAVNPVTGNRELVFVSEAREIEIGRSNYLPAQKS